MIGIIGTCKVVSNPTKTTYLFGNVKDIADKTLRIIEKNKFGDCLCLDHTGGNLVDIDHADVEKTIMFP
jgi:hypothetical protein